MRYMLVLLLLTACAHRPPETAEGIIAKYAPVCEKLGFEKDTDPWRNCILSRYDADRSEAASRRAAGAALFGAQQSRQQTCRFYGSTMRCY